MNLKIEVGRDSLRRLLDTYTFTEVDAGDIACWQELRDQLDAPYWRPILPEDLQKPMGFISGVSFHEAPAAHPIPQELRDRFNQIEEVICRNKMARDAVFTQMRTAVQSYFIDNPVRPPRCETCQDNGVIGWTTGQTPETFDQGEAPCPDCQPELTWEAQGEPNQYMLFKDGKWFAALQMNGELWVAQQETFFASIATPHKCLLPPEGWTCTRRAGHSGPCAATEDAPRPQ